MTGQQVARALHRRRRRVLLPVRLDLHRPPHAGRRPAAAVRDDGDRDLAEPAARVPRARRRDDAGQRPHLVALVPALPRWSGRSSAACSPTSIASACRARSRRGGSSTLGADPARVTVTGSLKFDSLDWPGVGPHGQSRDRVLRFFRLSPGRPVVVAGSTLRGEDEAVVRGVPPRPGALARRAAGPRAAPPRALRRSRAPVPPRKGFRVVRRTTLPIDAEPRADVVVLDTIGELAPLYQIATRRLRRRQPGRRRRPQHPRAGDLRQADRLRPAHAELRRDRGRVPAPTARRCRCRRRASSTRRLVDLVGDPVRRARLGAAARALVEANRGAKARTLAVDRRAAAAARRRTPRRRRCRSDAAAVTA